MHSFIVFTLLVSLVFGLRHEHKSPYFAGSAQDDGFSGRSQEKRGRIEPANHIEDGQSSRLHAAPFTGRDSHLFPQAEEVPPFAKRWAGVRLRPEKPCDPQIRGSCYGPLPRGTDDAPAEDNDLSGPNVWPVSDGLDHTQNNEEKPRKRALAVNAGGEETGIYFKPISPGGRFQDFDDTSTHPRFDAKKTVRNADAVDETDKGRKSPLGGL